MVGICRFGTIKGEKIMSKASVTFESVKKDLMIDNEFKIEYEKLQLRYEVISQIIQARKEQHGNAKIQYFTIREWKLQS